MLADRSDAVGAGPLDHERAGQDRVSGEMTGRLGLAGQHRLIEVKIGRREKRPVRDQLIAGLHDHDIVDDELLGRQRASLIIAPHPRRRRDQQREAIECPLRSHLLDDPDRRVGHDDAEEQGVARIPEDQRQRPEDGQDEVEHSQDIGPDDARVGSAGFGSPRATLAGQPSLGLGLAQSRRGSIAIRRPSAGDGCRSAAGRTGQVGHVATGCPGGLWA